MCEDRAKLFSWENVDLTGFEPVISAMRMRRITNCATGPWVDPRGIEPLSTPCHGVVLPVYYGPAAIYYSKIYLKNCAGLTATLLIRVSK